jgi:hypothetical protein
VKRNASKPERSRRGEPLKNPRREQRCATSRTRKLRSNEVPADRGACEAESTTQGSE